MLKTIQHPLNMQFLLTYRYNFTKAANVLTLESTFCHPS